MFNKGIIQHVTVPVYLRSLTHVSVPSFEKISAFLRYISDGTAFFIIIFFAERLPSDSNYL